MRLITPVIAALSVAAVWLLSVGAIAADAPREQMPPLWERVASDDPAVANAAAEEYRQLQEKIVGALVKILRNYDKKGTGGVDDAKRQRIDQISRTISLLGEMRSEAAAPVLTEFLVFNRTTAFNPSFRTPSKDDDNKTLFPAIGALIRIGKPAVLPTIAAVAGTPLREARQILLFPDYRDSIIPNAATVIVGIEGKKGTQHLLTDMASSAGDEKMRSAAKRLLDVVMAQDAAADAH